MIICLKYSGLQMTQRIRLTYQKLIHEKRTKTEGQDNIYYLKNFNSCNVINLSGKILLNHICRKLDNTG